MWLLRAVCLNLSNSRNYMLLLEHLHSSFLFHICMTSFCLPVLFEMSPLWDRNTYSSLFYLLFAMMLCFRLHWSCSSVLINLNCQLKNNDVNSYFNYWLIQFEIESNFEVDFESLGQKSLTSAFFKCEYFFSPLVPWTENCCAEVKKRHLKTFVSEALIIFTTVFLHHCINQTTTWLVEKVIYSLTDYIINRLTTHRLG